MSSLNPRSSPTASPCVGVCTATSLGDAICKGCLRTAEEVRDWNTYSDEKKIEINHKLRKRKQYEDNYWLSDTACRVLANSYYGLPLRSGFVKRQFPNCTLATLAMKRRGYLREDEKISKAGLVKLMAHLNKLKKLGRL